MMGGHLVGAASASTVATVGSDHYRPLVADRARGPAIAVIVLACAWSRNLGVQDAMNLGWKLAAHVQDRAPAGLLDSYHTERHPVAARVLATTRAQAALMSPPPDADSLLALCEIVTELARLPDANRYLTVLMSGLDLRYDFGDPDPLIGASMIDLVLRTAAGPTTVSTLLRPGRGLLPHLGGGQPSPPQTPPPPSVTRVREAGFRKDRWSQAGQQRSPANT